MEERGGRVVERLGKMMNHELHVVGVGVMQLEQGEMGDLGGGVEQGPGDDGGLDGMELGGSELGEGDDGRGVEEHDLVGGVAEKKIE